MPHNPNERIRDDDGNVDAEFFAVIGAALLGLAAIGVAIACWA